MQAEAFRIIRKLALAPYSFRTQPATCCAQKVCSLPRACCSFSAHEDFTPAKKSNMKNREHAAHASVQARTSRRQFGKTIAAALAAVPFAVKTMSAQTPPAATKQAPAPPNPQPTPAAPQNAPSPVAEAYAEVARLRFGEKLSADELARVKRDIEGNVRTAERLRASKLKNADEPDFIFIA
jgi:hypothetical protein